MTDDNGLKTDSERTERLKFRVWDSALETYRVDFYAGADGKLYYYHDSGLQELERIGDDIRWTVERCTGLRDAKGVLIYEGDILHYHIVTNSGDVIDEDVEVLWNESNPGWDLWQCADVAQEDSEVVGNIHEKEGKNDERF